MTLNKSRNLPEKQSTNLSKKASKKKLKVSSIKPTFPVKKHNFRLEKYTMNFEWTKNPKHNIFISLKDRIKLAWKVLRDES